MHELRAMVALASALALAGCQSLDGVRVNGMDLGGAAERAQSSTCGWPCVALGVVGAIGVGFLVAGGGGDSSSSGGGVSTGGSSGGGSGGPIGPVRSTGPCNGCWDDGGPSGGSPWDY